jgi:pyruvate/2-oxoglutarate dehydrogenase complex dihydrolipoamide dehydrogenase (E3) component
MKQFTVHRHVTIGHPAGLNLMRRHAMTDPFADRVRELASNAAPVPGRPSTLERDPVRVTPLDEPDAQLMRRVRPSTWRNPEPAPTYDLVVLGGGTAGLVSALGAAGLGARVALAERHLLGGDCLNTGCVPSKAVLRSARAVGEIRRAARVGVRGGDVTVDFAAVMRRMRERRASIAAHDAAERLRAAGVDVFFGNASFADERTVLVDGRALRFRRAVIATGGRPAAPPIPGLDACPYHTNETIFSVTELPNRLLVIGAGPIGCELAQAFARFGSTITVFDRAEQALSREDADAAAIIQRSLESDGVGFQLGARLDQVDFASGEARIHFTRSGNGTPEAGSALGDAVLVATGRAPNIEDLNLAAAGIQASKAGVVVNDRLQTTNLRVFASGDVCSDYKFTHAADALSRIVLQNALFFGRRKASALVIPWVTYTDPELAHVGVSETDVVRSDGRLETITIPLAEIDRAIVDDQTDGFVRVHHERGRIRGCTIVAPHAGEMIGEVVYAMNRGGTLSTLAATIHPYPTYAEALRKAGDVYRRQFVTPRVRVWLERYFAWTR